MRRARGPARLLRRARRRPRRRVRTRLHRGARRARRRSGRRRHPGQCAVHGATRGRVGSAVHRRADKRVAELDPPIANAHESRPLGLLERPDVDADGRGGVGDETDVGRRRRGDDEQCEARRLGQPARRARRRPARLSLRWGRVLRRGWQLRPRPRLRAGSAPEVPPVARNRRSALPSGTGLSPCMASGPRMTSRSRPVSVGAGRSAPASGDSSFVRTPTMIATGSAGGRRAANWIASADRIVEPLGIVHEHPATRLLLRNRGETPTSPRRSPAARH